MYRDTDTSPGRKSSKSHHHPRTAMTSQLWESSRRWTLTTSKKVRLISLIVWTTTHNLVVHLLFSLIVSIVTLNLVLHLLSPPIHLLFSLIMSASCCHSSCAWSPTTLPFISRFSNSFRVPHHTPNTVTASTPTTVPEESGVLGYTFHAHSCAAHSPYCTTGWNPAFHSKNGVVHAKYA